VGCKTDIVDCGANVVYEGARVTNEAGTVITCKGERERGREGERERGRGERYICTSKYVVNHLHITSTNPTQ